MSMYTCRCLCVFEESLGAYGCPNCLGDKGPASLSDGSDGRFFYRTVTVTREQFEQMYPPKEAPIASQE